MRRALIVPFQIISGGNRITLFAQLDAPRDDRRHLGPEGHRRDGGARRRAPPIPTRSSSTASCCGCASIPSKQRIDVEQGDLGNMEVGVAISGSLDYAGDDPRLALGIAGNRMSVAAMKRLWPAMITPEGAHLGRRSHRERHGRAGGDRHQCAAVDAEAERPADARRWLSIEITGSGAEIRPVEGLAGDPRCRHERAHHRPHRDDQCRPRQCRSLSRPQARDHQRRVRGARHPSQRAAGARSASASTGRCRLPPNCSRSTGCANSPARRSIPRPAAARSARRSRSACRCGTICRPARRNTRSTSTSRTSPPSTW